MTQMTGEEPVTADVSVRTHTHTHTDTHTHLDVTDSVGLNQAFLGSQCYGTDGEQRTRERLLWGSVPVIPALNPLRFFPPDYSGLYETCPVLNKMATPAQTVNR